MEICIENKTILKQVCSPDLTCLYRAENLSVTCSWQAKNTGESGLELPGVGVQLPVHVYKRSFLSENRL